MKYKAVIFDLDGTLIDSIQGISYSLNRMLSKNGFPVHSVEKCKRLVGNGFAELVRSAVPEGHRDQEEIRVYLAELRAEYKKHWAYGMSVYDGIKELLAYLKAHGISFAVDTNKDENVAKRIVEEFLPQYSFSRIAGTTPKVTVKPDPARALSIAAQWGVLPSQCIYLGDSEVDILTARSAGMFSVSVSWGFRESKELVEAGARHILTEPMDLIGYLG